MLTIQSNHRALFSGTAIEDLGDLLSFDATTSDSTTTHPTPAQPSANGRQASPPANQLQTSEASERTPLLNGGGGEMQQYTLPQQPGKQIAYVPIYT